MSVTRGAATHHRLQQLSRAIADIRKAITGLARAAEAEQAFPEKRAAIERKLASFHVRQQSLQDEQAALIRLNPERQVLLQIEEELRQLRRATGLDAEEVVLKRLQRERGRRSGRSGESFEQSTERIVATEILPELVDSGENVASGDVYVIRSVTLGAARLEIDQLVVRQPPRHGEPVEVLAIVEAKRNLNDVAHGFRRRQENIAWLTGDAAAYDSRTYRTRWFASGHFDRPAVHQHAGSDLLFTRHSFRHFRRDAVAPWFLDRLYWITRPGPMWGLSSSALHRISYRVATDRRWNPTDEEYLYQLMQWCRGLSHQIETPDVLRIYAPRVQLPRHILLDVAHRPRHPPIFDPDDSNL